MHVEKHTLRLAVLAAILLFNMMLGSPAAAQMAGKIEARTITLGIVSEIDQKEIEEHFQKFIRYVSAKLPSASKIEGKVVIAPTPSRLANLLTARKADFYMESPYPTYLINSVYGAGKLLLRRWKGGMADYHALIFTSRNSETKRLEDLRGKVIAFEDSESTSGYFLPKLFLTRRGFKLFDRVKSKPLCLAGKSVTFLPSLKPNSSTSFSLIRWRLELLATTITPLLRPAKNRT